MSRLKSETKEQYNARMNAYMKAKYKAVQIRLNDYKASVGCVDCGYNKHGEGMEFDHVNERLGNTNDKVSALAVRGYDVVMKHIQENCEVVCGTCHNIRTWHRRVHRAIMPSQPGEISVYSYDNTTPCEYDWCLVV